MFPSLILYEHASHLLFDLKFFTSLFLLVWFSSEYNLIWFYFRYIIETLSFIWFIKPDKSLTCLLFGHTFKLLIFKI